MSGVSSASHRGRNGADDLPGHSVDDLLDAAAAAIILQDYLDRDAHKVDS